MFISWRKQQYLDDLKAAKQACRCENNGDLCDPCQAREALAQQTERLMEGK